MSAVKINNNYLVYHSNAILRGAYSLTLDQKRLIIAGLASCNQTEDLPDQITVSACDYSDIFGISINNAYNQIKNAAQDLYDKDVTFSYTTDEGVNVHESCRWIYKKIERQGMNQSEVTLHFSPEICPYLGNLKKEFTSYRIRHVSSLKSVYSIRIYELMCQHMEKGSFYLWVSDFRKLFELENKYKMFSEIKKFILNPAMKELNKKSNVNIDFTTEMKGRTVNKIIFNFSEKDQTELEFNK